MGETLVGPSAVDAFLATVPEPMGALARATAAKVRAALPGATETCEGGDIGFSVGTGYKGIVFTITPHEKHVSLGVADGALLKDMTGLLEGKGKSHRHVRIESESDLKRGALDRLLLEAVKRRKR
jgi:hypothetical protein